MTNTDKKQKRRKEAGRAALLCGAAGAGGLLFSLKNGDVQTGLLLLLLGLAAGAALLYLPAQEEKQEKEKRLRALQADYAGMVTRLGLYMTAGLSLRSSWERAIRDYEEDLAAGGRRRIVYEEMEITRRAIMGGVYEDKAYADFGRRCGAPEYLRLGSLLETYVQQGNRELFQILEQEAATGKGENAGLHYQHNFKYSQAHKQILDVGLDYKHYDNNTVYDINGNVINNGVTYDLPMVSVSYADIHRSNNDFVAWSVGYSGNIGNSGHMELNRANSDKHFHLWKASVNVNFPEN